MAHTQTKQHKHSPHNKDHTEKNETNIEHELVFKSITYIYMFYK